MYRIMFNIMSVVFFFITSGYVRLTHHAYEHAIKSSNVTDNRRKKNETIRKIEDRKNVSAQSILIMLCVFMWCVFSDMIALFSFHAIQTLTFLTPNYFIDYGEIYGRWEEEWRCMLDVYIYIVYSVYHLLLSLLRISCINRANENL